MRVLLLTFDLSLQVAAEPACEAAPLVTNSITLRVQGSGSGSFLRIRWFFEPKPPLTGLSEHFLVETVRMFCVV